VFAVAFTANRYEYSNCRDTNPDEPEPEREHEPRSENREE
jgi:hypothetical protein